MQILTSLKRSLLVAVLPMVVGSAMAERLAITQSAKQLKADCNLFGNPERTNAGGKYAIKEQGHYCLTEDLHARIEFADHPAEQTMIAIYTGDVVLDLQGHTLGRGRIFKNPGGMGIKIVDPKRTAKGIGLAQNIVIRNGILQDFDIGIILAGRWQSDQPDTPTYDPATNTYHFPANNITLENITFKNNKKNFDIPVPDEPKK